MIHLALYNDGRIAAACPAEGRHNPLGLPPEGGTLLTVDVPLKIIDDAWSQGKVAKLGVDGVIVEDSKPIAPFTIPDLPKRGAGAAIPRLEWGDGGKIDLVSVGGGLDSTFILYDLLKNTDDDVHAFFLDMSAVEYEHPRAAKGFWKASANAEEIAAYRVRDWLVANVRRYELQTVRLKSSDESRAPAVIRMAASMVNGCDRFIFGRAPEQMCTARNTAYYKQIWAEIAPKGIPMLWPLVEQSMGRPHAIAALPLELQALTISCHGPSIVDGAPRRDGACQKCLATDAAREMHKRGIDPDAALDWLMSKTGAGPYVGAPSVDPRFQSARATDEFEFLRSPEEKAVRK